jgi:NAD(P)-dependent dehydrogenase (short-subunit alcohol dehydrogenase family)
MRENGKPEVVVVTGASAGVGRAIAHAFAKRGARIGLIARGEKSPTYAAPGAAATAATSAARATIAPQEAGSCLASCMRARSVT